MKNSIIYSLSLLLIANIFLSVQLHAQVAVNGLTCVPAGGSNGIVYTLSGNVQGTDNITWTITGGTIASSGGVTKSGTIDGIGNQVRVVWNNDANAGNIRLSTNRLGTANLNVKIITIKNTIKSDKLAYALGSAFTVSGEGPSLKSCSAMYDFWWEKSSADTGPFDAIDNASGQNLQVSQHTGKTYFRRVLSINGDIIFSNVIVVNLAQ